MPDCRTTFCEFWAVTEHMFGGFNSCATDTCIKYSSLKFVEVVSKDPMSTQGLSKVEIWF